jgi:hypothetical protein
LADVESLLAPIATLASGEARQSTA